MKKTITENQLKTIVFECVEKILKETANSSNAKKQAYKDMIDSGVDPSYIDHEKDILSLINGGAVQQKGFDGRKLNNPNTYRKRVN